MKTCPKCGSGSYEKTGGLIKCLQCGNTLETVGVPARMSPVITKVVSNRQTSTKTILISKSPRPAKNNDYKPRKKRALKHYSKVAENHDEIEEAICRGIGIRQASREFGIAINTVRGIVRKSEKASQAQKARREREKESHWLQFALKGLAVHADRYTSEEMFDHAMALLGKYMKGNPQRTVFELLPEARNGTIFSVDDLIRATIEMMIREHQNYDSSTFVYVGNDTYKVRSLIAGENK